MSEAPRQKPYLYTVKQVAPLLNLSVPDTYELIQQGVIPCQRIGRRIRIPADALERWIEANTVGGKVIARHGWR